MHNFYEICSNCITVNWSVNCHNLGIHSRASGVMGDLFGGALFKKLSAPLTTKLYVRCEHFSEVQEWYGSPRAEFGGAGSLGHCAFNIFTCSMRSTLPVFQLHGGTTEVFSPPSAWRQQVSLMGFKSGAEESTEGQLLQLHAKFHSIRTRVGHRAPNIQNVMQF